MNGEIILRTKRSKGQNEMNESKCCILAKVILQFTEHK